MLERLSGVYIVRQVVTGAINASSMLCFVHATTVVVCCSLCSDQCANTLVACHIDSTVCLRLLPLCSHVHTANTDYHAMTHCYDTLCCMHVQTGVTGQHYWSIV
jgi:hypothetical protein